MGVNWDVSKEKKLTEELKELNNHLQYFAYYDSLTGLMNRKAFEDSYNRITAQAKRHHYQLGVMFVDLDCFKNVNDSFGHQVGDELLIKVAKILQSFIRSEDILARLGGMNFVSS